MSEEATQETLEDRATAIEARIEMLERLYGIDHSSSSPASTTVIGDNRYLVSVPGCQVYITSFVPNNTITQAIGE